MILRKRHFTSFGIFLVFLIICVIAFENCSKVHLSPLVPERQVSSVVGAEAQRLPIPRKDPGNARVVVLLDQSFSMVWGKCPQDLDGTAPNPTGSPFSSCQRGPGVDQPGYRYDVTKAWLDELSGIVEKGMDVKVMLLPFSGGKAKRPNPIASPVHNLKDLDHMKFLDVPKAGIWLSALRQEQDAMKANGNREIMGTTVFDPIFDYAYAEIVREATLLKEQDKLATTPFLFVVISDGVYKPTNGLFGLLRQVSGCPNCSTTPNHIACTCFSTGVCWSGPGEAPGRYCQLLEQNFREYLGDPAVNQLDEVVVSLNNILKLEQDPDFLGFRISMKFAKMNWLAVPSEDTNRASDKTKNIFDEVQTSLIRRQIPIYNITNGTPPFPVVNLGGDSSTYLIENFYAINTNIYVNKFGNLNVDSDGDGLGDEEEASQAMDPGNPRSNGICLDGITVNYGCQKLGCRPDIDMDRDGLNECEETTVGTRDITLDSDADHIPDFFEALRFLKPGDDDRGSKSSGDGFTDHDHFRYGVHPLRQLSSVLDRYKVDLVSSFMGYELVSDQSGAQQAVAKYVVDLRSMPLAPTQAVASSSILVMKSSSGSGPIEDEVRLDPIAKEAHVNRVYFLLEMATLENRQKISWHLLKMDVSAPEGAGSYSLPGSFSFDKFVQIQGEPP